MQIVHTFVFWVMEFMYKVVGFREERPFQPRSFLFTIASSKISLETLPPRKNRICYDTGLARVLLKVWFVNFVKVVYV